MKQLMAFDLDGTLAESKAPLDDEVAGLLAALLSFAQVAVISGGDWPQFKKQVVDRLPPGAELGRLWILPTAGAKLFRFAGEWRQAYSEEITPAEKAHILKELDRAIKAAGLDRDPAWGPRIEDRGTQITYSGIGQKAPLEAKEAWDPDRRKRLQLQATLRRTLPEWSVNIGGTTSIDITRAGIDKGFGLRKLAAESGVPLQDMVFVGDSIFPGGNDYPAVTVGVDAVAVRDVRETKSILHALTLWLGR
ncbi:HAD-IIB family hydrolase [Sphingomonas koreensis]|uniref:phosphomannomutase n=1 Tax=Sphingomonas koreensis TaxID=93064 RepID=A0A430FXS3_9SPHN|nr:HAD-IIB family hydrolase [Sphingomonas koreensis]RSY76613.1 HAD-IIB family hydrolase [Sphingomonas koreensis]